MYHCDELLPLRYIDLDFQSDKDSRKSISRFVFTLSGGAISWSSVKQSCIANLTMKDMCFQELLFNGLFGTLIIISKSYGNTKGVCTSD